MASNDNLNVQGLTEKNKAALRKQGWKTGPGHWKYCRICRREIAPWRYCWFSPGYVAYHNDCVLKSPLARKAIKL